MESKDNLKSKNNLEPTELKPFRDEIHFEPLEVDFANMVIRQKPGNPLGWWLGDYPNNYAEFKPDGELNLHGTARVYDGIELDPTNFKEPPANSATKVNRGIDIAYEYTDNQDTEHLHASVRIPSKWVDTEDINVILIWSSPATSKNCDWEIRYLFIANNEDTTNATTEGTASGIFACSATANGLVHSSITIPTAAFNAGDKILVFEIYRDGNDVLDTLSASAFLQGINVRGIANKIGGSL